MFILYAKAYSKYAHNRTAAEEKTLESWAGTVTWLCEHLCVFFDATLIKASPAPLQPWDKNKNVLFTSPTTLG